MLLIIAGFIGAVVTAASSIPGTPDSTNVADILAYAAPAVGYGFVGFAWWQWTRGAIESGVGSANSLRRSSRTLALAAAATGIGYLAQAYGDLRFITSLPNRAGLLGLHYIELRDAGELAGGLGFLMAAIGFWLASTAIQRVPLSEESVIVEATMPSG